LTNRPEGSINPASSRNLKPPALAGGVFTRFPDAFGPEESLISIEAIVNAFVFLYGQPARGWSFEVDVRTSREKW
jgi:hypothetical protein